MSVGDRPASRHEVRIRDSILSVVDEGQGPPILLGQGYLWDWTMWEPQVRALSSRFRVVVPELWGHGGSGPLPEGTRTLSGLASQMIDLLDRLDIDRCVVAGSSVGGMWGAHLAALAPERVAGLVLMNSFLGEEPTPKRLSYAGMLDQVEAAGRIGDGVAAAITPLFFSPTIEERAPDLPGIFRERLRAFNSEELHRSIIPLGRMIFDRPDAMAVLDKIDAPTLIVAGESDQGRVVEESRAMARRLRAELVVIPDCGHTATLEKPAEVNAVLLRYLDAIGWGSPGIERRMARLRAVGRETV